MVPCDMKCEAMVPWIAKLGNCRGGIPMVPLDYDASDCCSSLSNFDATFIVDYDASDSGLRVVLHQGEGLITFFNCSILPHHTRLATYEHELIGLVKVVHHWHPFIGARLFVVRTDHYNLKFLLDKRLSTIPQHAWVSKLFGYQFKFKPRA
jgi:hypothetical protein